MEPRDVGDRSGGLLGHQLLTGGVLGGGIGNSRWPILRRPFPVLANQSSDFRLGSIFVEAPKSLHPGRNHSLDLS